VTAHWKKKLKYQESDNQHIEQQNYRFIADFINLTDFHEKQAGQGTPRYERVPLS
jgi:hypothetical protein